MADQQVETTQNYEHIKKAVRERYAATVKDSSGCSCGCGTSRPDLVELAHYTPEQLGSIPQGAVEHALGCGNPLSFAGVLPGDVVLDIGSGAGIDALLASKLVGPTGKVIGLDFTPEMIEKARENAARAGATNVEFRQGDAENMPVEDSSVDWIISNCVINLAPDKRKVFGEVTRVLKPGGRVSISDIVTGELPSVIRNSLAMWANCIGGAVEEGEYLRIMREAGLSQAEIEDLRVRGVVTWPSGPAGASGQ